MDSTSVLKQLLRSVFHELFRSKNAYNLLASALLLTVIAIGYLWEETYISKATLSINAQSGSATGNTDYQQAHNIFNLANSRLFFEEITALIEQTYHGQNHDVINSSHEHGDILTIEQVMQSSRITHSGNLIKLSYHANNPDEAHLVVGLMITTLMDMAMSSAKLRELKVQHNLLVANEDAITQELKEKQAQILALNSPALERNSIRHNDRINTIQESLQDAKVNTKAIEARLDVIREQLSKEEALRSQRERLSALKMQREKLTARLKEEKEIYPSTSAEIVSLHRELDRINIEITRLSTNRAPYSSISESLYEKLRSEQALAEVERTSLISRYTSLNELLQQELVKANAGQSQSLELENLKRQYDAISTRYSDVKKLQEANREQEQRLSKDLPSIIVLDEASTPKKYAGFGFVEFLIMGPIVAFGLPLFIASALVLSDSRIRTSCQLKGVMPMDVPVLGVIPHYDSPKTLRVFRKAILGLIAWGIFVFFAYATIGVIGLNG